MLFRNDLILYPFIFGLNTSEARISIFLNAFSQQFETIYPFIFGLNTREARKLMTSAPDMPTAARSMPP